MLFSYVTLGALAATANAFLVPLNSENLAANDLSINQGPQTVNLDCSTCPYALKSEQNGEHGWSSDVANDLEMKFEVVDNALTFNGVQLFPVARPGLPPVLSVTQKAKDGVETSVEALNRDLRLSYSLEIAQKAFNDNTNLITVTMSVMALDGQMVRVDDMEVKVIKTADGLIHLHSATAVTPDPNADEAKCGNVMCRVFAKLLSSIAKAKSTIKTAAHKVKCLCVKCFHCVMRVMGHKMHHHHKGPHGPPGVPQRLPDGTLELPSHHHMKPQDGRPHPHHHHKWHNKSFFGRMVHILWVTVKIAFIPILIGIAFGMAASAVGMLVGQAVVFLWMRYRRDAAPAYAPLDTDEKAEVPPPYEDLDVKIAEALNEKEAEAKA